MKVLITGIAGFIGHAVAKSLASHEIEIIGIDNINNYYDTSLKRSRLDELALIPNIKFKLLDLSDREGISTLFKVEKFDKVIHLAAQAGVRYSIDNPFAYADSNLLGFLNILEGCRTTNVTKLIYASSSSVYGENSKIPFSTSDDVNKPVSLYAATKKSNELMSHAYSNLYGFETIGLRFFTVYGPWGRPDMAPFKFTKAILQGSPIDVYNNGNMQRDFTYIDDIVEGVISILNLPSNMNENLYKIYNIGNGNPIQLMDFIKAIENTTGRKAICNFLPMQPGDVSRTWADIEELNNVIGNKPRTSIKDGVRNFVDWYVSYYNIKV